MANWKDLGNVWSTLRELDVNDIREESEQPLCIACVGTSPLLDILSGLLRRRSDARYGPVGLDPLRYITPSDLLHTNLSHADTLVLVLDGCKTLTRADSNLVDRLTRLTIPILVVVLYSEHFPDAAAGDRLAALTTARTVVIPEPAALDAADRLADALLAALPGELHLAAARRLPGLRTAVARDLVSNTSFSNATYSLASGLPAQIPILSVPFAAADILILTKNQAMLVYKLALGHGAPPDFQSRLREVLPVIGGAYIWRQLARSLVGLIPVWGVVPKVAVAYAGTYTTGVVAWRWYARGELVSGERLKSLSQEALNLGRERAQKLLEQARERDQQPPGRVRQFFVRSRRMLPGQRQE